MSQAGPGGGPLEVGGPNHRRRWLILAVATVALVALGWYLYVALGVGMEGCACAEPTPSMTTTSTA